MRHLLPEWLCSAAAVAVLVSVVSGPARAAEELPWARCEPEGTCVVGTIPSVVGRDEVARYLTNGLTSSLAVTLSGRAADGSRVSGSARVDVRFDPWDEVFYVTLLEPRTRPRRLTKPSLEALGTWWKALELRLSVAHPIAGKARLDITLVPFSEEEEADARDWYRDAVREGDGGPLTAVLDVFTVTSIKRRDVLHYSWSVTLRH
jgi:hypothetical protein